MTCPPSATPTRRAWTLGALASLGLAGVAWGQAYPSRPVQLVVAAPAGGPSDALARMVAEELGKGLGQPVVVDNRPGAGGLVAAEAVMRAPADGHTVLMSWIGSVTSQVLMPRPGLDINRDFSHVTQLVYGANVLMVHPSLGVKTLAELVARARQQPGRLSYASAGNGSSGHLAMELLKQRTGVSILHIPYRGGAPAMNDLLGGQVPMMFINQDAAMAQAKAQRLLPLAITSPQRNPMLPDVPTVAELGYPGFEATAWAGLSVPKAVPRAVVERLHQAALVALQGSVKARQEANGASVVGSTPAQFAAFIQSETRLWERVIKTAGIQPD